MNFEFQSLRLDEHSLELKSETGSACKLVSQLTLEQEREEKSKERKANICKGLFGQMYVNRTLTKK